MTNQVFWLLNESHFLEPSDACQLRATCKDGLQIQTRSFTMTPEHSFPIPENLLHLVLNLVQHCGPEIKEILEQMPKLETLRLRKCDGLLTNPLPDQVPSLKTLELNDCFNLQITLIQSHLPNLENLIIHKMPVTNGLWIGQWQTIRKFVLHSIAHLTVNVIRSISICPSLQEFHGFYLPLSFHEIKETLQMHRLTVFELVQPRQDFMRNHIGQIQGRLLVELYLQQCEVPEDFYAYSFPCLKKVVHRQSNVTNRMIELMLRYNPLLEHIDVVGCSAINPDVLELVERHRTLAPLTFLMNEPRPTIRIHVTSPPDILPFTVDTSTQVSPDELGTNSRTWLQKLWKPDNIHQEFLGQIVGFFVIWLIAVCWVS